MRIILFIIIASCFSCKTTKFVEKEKIVVDSTSIKERDAVTRVLKEEIERHEKEKERWDSLGVSFYEPKDYIYGATDSLWSDFPSIARIGSKVTFENGKIKSIEGNIKSLNQSLYEKQAEVYDAHSTIDSMGIEMEKLQVELSKKQTVVHKEVKKTIIPWWIWLIAAGTLIVGTFFPTAKRFIKQKLNI